MRRRHARRVNGPGLRQIQSPVNESVAMARHIGGEDADLAVGDLARRASVLPANATRRLALLQETGLINHQNSIVIRKGFNDILTHNVPQCVRIPSPAAKNGLLPPRTGIARCLRAHPTRLAPFITQKAVQERTRRRRHTILCEQRPHPSLRIPQRISPEFQRRLDRSTHNP